MIGRHLSPLTAAVALSLAVLAAPISAQQQRAPLPSADRNFRGSVDLKGTATNAAGEGLRALVTVRYMETNTGTRVNAEANGEFALRDLRPGRWELTINAAAIPPGYGVEKFVIEVQERDNDAIDVVLTTFADLIGQAGANYESGNYRAARENYQKVLWALPDNYQIQMALAMTYQYDEMYDEALDAFDALLAAWAGGMLPPTPDTPTEVRLEAMMSAGKATQYLRMHAYSEEIGVPLSTNSVRTLVDLSANTLLERGQRNHAIQVLGLAIAQSPNSPLPYYYRGISHFDAERERELAAGELENWDDAIADLTKFLALSANDTPQVRQARDLLTTLQRER